MIVNLSEYNITAGNYAFVKKGTVSRHALKRACGELPFVVVSLNYKIQKHFYEMAVLQVTQKALAVFNLYGQGDIRMTELLAACRLHSINLENLLCPDGQLELKNVSTAVDLIVLDYLENQVLYDVAKDLREGVKISEDIRNEAIQSVRQFATLAAAKINSTVTASREDVQAVEDVSRSFRETDLRNAVNQLNAYSSALKELTP